VLRADQRGGAVAGGAAEIPEASAVHVSGGAAAQSDDIMQVDDAVVQSDDVMVLARQAQNENLEKLRQVYMRLEQMVQGFREAVGAVFGEYTDEKSKNRLAGTIERHQLMRWLSIAVCCEKPALAPRSKSRLPYTNQPMVKAQHVGIHELEGMFERMRRQDLPEVQAHNFGFKKLMLSERDLGEGASTGFGLLLHVITGMHAYIHTHTCIHTFIHTHTHTTQVDVWFAAARHYRYAYNNQGPHM
jgi:hypothetical protein